MKNLKRAPPSNKRRPLKSAAPKTSKILRAPRRLIEEIRYIVTWKPEKTRIFNDEKLYYIQKKFFKK